MVKRLAVLSLETYSQQAIEPDAGLEVSTPHNFEDLVQDEDGLLAILLPALPLADASIEQRLKAHPQLVTPGLWQTVIDRVPDLPADEALHLYRVALLIARQLDDVKLTATTLHYVAGTYSLTGDYKQAISFYLRSKQEYERAELTLESAYVLSDLSDVYLYLDDLEQARGCAKEALRRLSAWEESNKRSVEDRAALAKAQALHNLGVIGREEGNQPDALAYLQQALSVYKGLIYDDDAHLKPLVANCLADIGHTYRVSGNHRVAAHHLLKALDEVKEAKDEGREIAARILNSLGVLYLEQSDYERAAQYFSESLRRYKSLRDEVEISRTLSNLGVVNLRLGLYQSALDNFNESLVVEKSGGTQREVVPMNEQS